MNWIQGFLLGQLTTFAISAITMSILRVIETRQKQIAQKPVTELPIVYRLADDIQGSTLFDVIREAERRAMESWSPGIPSTLIDSQLTYDEWRNWELLPNTYGKGKYGVRTRHGVVSLDVARRHPRDVMQKK